MHKGSAHLFFKLRKLTAQRRLPDARERAAAVSDPASQIALKIRIRSQSSAIERLLLLFFGFVVLRRCAVINRPTPIKNAQAGLLTMNLVLHIF